MYVKFFILSPPKYLLNIKQMRKITLFTIVLCLFGASVFAGGYQVRLQGHRQTSMGLVGVSLFGDASNLFYNPAGLSKMKTKWSFMLGGSGIFSTTAFQLENSAYNTKTDNPVGTPFFLYAAGMVTEKLGVGVGVYTPFGSSAKWDEDWVGSHLIQDISLKAIFIQPTVSYKINDMFSLGAGFVIASGSVDLNRALPYSSAETTGQVYLSGSTIEYGYNVGVTITPGDQFSIGIDYRSKVAMQLEDGDADFTIPTSVENLIPKKNYFNAELPLPANLDIGVAYMPNEKLTLALELDFVFWGVYDSLKFEFKEKPELLNSSNPRLYSNTAIFRVGGEYVINDLLTVRGGFYYDPTPTNSEYFTPETPSLNTYGFSCGLSIYPTKNLAIDISYLHLETQESVRSYSPEYFTGTYKSRTMIPGIGVSYNF
jgi:long-chain fatty acid transport protein